jgi:glycosyltransferase involved in cell wall biosynthesis
VKLVFTGSGQIDAPEDLRPHITDLGFVSEQDKREAMAGAAAFIHPSVNESLGIVLLESWLAGTPALVHAKGEVLSWQCRRSGGGLWFKRYPEFEEELLLLLDNENLRRAMGDAGRAYVKREYSWESVEKRMLAALDSL